MKSYTLRPDTFTLNFNSYSVRYHPFSPNGFESQEDIFRNIMYGAREGGRICIEHWHWILTSSNLPVVCGFFYVSLDHSHSSFVFIIRIHILIYHSHSLALSHSLFPLHPISRTLFHPLPPSPTLSPKDWSQRNRKRNVERHVTAPRRPHSIYARPEPHHSG